MKSPVKSPYKVPRLGKSQLDPLASAVEENLRQSRQHENNKAEDSSKAGAERDTSRTPPPVVSGEEAVAAAAAAGADLVDKRVLDSNVISRSDEANLNAKAKAQLQLGPEMTVSSIVRELVFHDKVTCRLPYFRASRIRCRCFFPPNVADVIQGSECGKCEINRFFSGFLFYLISWKVN